VVLWLVASCNLLPTSSGGPKLIINGTEVNSVPWADGEVGTVVWDSGLSESATSEQFDVALMNGPWYLPRGDEITVDYSDFSDDWNSSVHGLYSTTGKQETVGSNIRYVFTKNEYIEPVAVDGSTMTYSCDKLLQLSMWSDSEESLFYLIVTPYEEGVFLVSIIHKLVNITK